MKNPANASDPVSPEGRDLSIKFTIIFGLFAFIPLVLMWHFLSVKDSNAPTKQANEGGDSPSPPAIKFRNITAEAGIAFTRESGARGEKLLPETMGSGCAFFDFDNDGDQDVLLINSTSWPHNSPTFAPTPMSLTFCLEDAMFGGVTFVAITCGGRVVINPFVFESYDKLAIKRVVRS